MQTREDPSGRLVKGTLNNCGGGITLWNTVLTAEENFHQYFANRDGVTEKEKRDAHARYGLPRGASERKRERFDQRFDLSVEPNEPFRFGWIVEYDPYRPELPPVKRTALGRFKHEAATCVLTADGRVALYMGDDERFEYMYKFVTSGRYNPSNRDANRNLLDSGTLYVARFYEDGTGEWIPLVYGVGPLTERNGFRSQADVCIKTRQAADLVGATAMDRPEDIETNPVNNRVYCVMTNNTRRGTGSNPGPNAANPRANNRHGHIIELMPENGDHGSTRFRWNIFLLCGPKDDPTAYFAGFPKEWVSGISCPDNITFDDRGILWIATDGQPSSLGVNDGIFAVPTEGIERGACRQFLARRAGLRGGQPPLLARLPGPLREHSASRRGHHPCIAVLDLPVRRRATPDGGRRLVGNGREDRRLAWLRLRPPSRVSFPAGPVAPFGRAYRSILSVEHSLALGGTVPCTSTPTAPANCAADMRRGWRPRARNARGPS